MPVFGRSYWHAVAGGGAVAFVCLGAFAASYSRPYASSEPITQAIRPIDQMPQGVNDPQLIAAITRGGPPLRDHPRGKMRKAAAIEAAWIQRGVLVDAPSNRRGKPMSAWRRAYIAEHGHQPPTNKQ